jgi:flagellar export protein FliJ
MGAVPKPKYRLQPVLEVRDQAKQAASRLVATRREQLIAAETELARRVEEVRKCQQRQGEARQRLLQESSKEVEAQVLQAHRTHLADLRRIEQELNEKAAEQRNVVAAANQELEQAIAELIEASREVQVIEKHRETWQQKTRREEQLREQKVGDEIGAVTHRLRNEK